MTNDNLTQILEPNKTPNLVPNSDGFDAGKSHMGVHKLFRLVFFRLRKEKAPWIELAICVAYAVFMVGACNAFKLADFLLIFIGFFELIIPRAFKDLVGFL